MLPLYYTIFSHLSIFKYFSNFHFFYFLLCGLLEQGHLLTDLPMFTMTQSDLLVWRAKSLFYSDFSNMAYILIFKTIKQIYEFNKLSGYTKTKFFYKYAWIFYVSVKEVFILLGQGYSWIIPHFHWTLS